MRFKPCFVLGPIQGGSYSSHYGCISVKSPAEQQTSYSYSLFTRMSASFVEFLVATSFDAPTQLSVWLNPRPAMYGAYYLLVPIFGRMHGCNRIVWQAR